MSIIHFRVVLLLLYTRGKKSFGHASRASHALGHNYTIFKLFFLNEIIDKIIIVDNIF